MKFVYRFRTNRVRPQPATVSVHQPTTSTAATLFTAPPTAMMGLTIPPGIDFSQYIQLTKIAAELKSEEIQANAETGRQAQLQIQVTLRAEQEQMTLRAEQEQMTNRANIQADADCARSIQLTAQNNAQTKAAKYRRGEGKVRTYDHHKKLGSQSFVRTLLVAPPAPTAATPVTDVSGSLRRLRTKCRIRKVR